MGLELGTVKCEYCPVRMRWRSKEEEPRKDGYYLVTEEVDGYKRVTTAYYAKESSYWAENVKAWMPLPKEA